MDNQSTPIESLNNSQDDSQVVNQILDKYNTLQSGGSGELPPLNPSIPNMEKQFDNRNLNAEVFNHSSQNIAYQNDYNNQMQRTKQFQQQQNMQVQDDDEYEENYEQDRNNDNSSTDTDEDLLNYMKDREENEDMVLSIKQKLEEID